MKSTLLTVLLVFILVCSNLILSFSISAESDTRIRTSGKSIINITTGLAALYLLSRLTIFRDQQQNNVEKRLDNINRLSSIRNSPYIDDKVIVIDPGHGGYDPGAIGPGGLEEKNVNIEIALKLYKLLKQHTGAGVYLTREDDRFVPLQDRTNLANRVNADIFISIHSNADEQGIENGIETYAHHSAPGKNWALAWHIHESLVKELLLLDRGLKAGNFQVIRETSKMESLLLEIGYISHKKEESLLSESNFREKAARAIYNGILNYYAALYMIPSLNKNTVI